MADPGGYCVWRRSDGHVDWTAGMRVPRGWRDVTFTEILSTGDLEGARMRLHAERYADEMGREDAATAAGGKEQGHGA